MAEIKHNIFQDNEVVATVSDASSNDHRFRTAQPPALVISDDRNGRLLLRIEIRDGVLHAIYDPADLTDAAIVFVEECKKYAGG